MYYTCSRASCSCQPCLSSVSCGVCALMSSSVSYVRSVRMFYAVTTWLFIRDCCQPYLSSVSCGVSVLKSSSVSLAYFYLSLCSYVRPSGLSVLIYSVHVYNIYVTVHYLIFKIIHYLIFKILHYLFF